MAKLTVGGSKAKLRQVAALPFTSTSVLQGSARGRAPIAWPRASLLAAIALMTSIAQPADAQEIEPAESVVVMHRYGHCVAFKPRFRAQRVLSLAPGSKAELRLLGQLSTSDCLSREAELRFQPQLLRGAMAEAYFETDFGRIGTAPRREAIKPFSGLTGEDVAALTEHGRKVLRALVFAQCVAEAAPDRVTALLDSEPASAAERQAFTQLTPHLPPCLPHGARIEVSRPQLRGILAEAAYRNAYAASDRRR